MRVGVYIDGFNLYYGMKQYFGDRPGWRWLDLKGLSNEFIRWHGASLASVTYCTARVNDPEKPTQRKHQGHYIDALKMTGVHVVEGFYSSWAKEASVVKAGGRNKSPELLKDADCVIALPPELPIRRLPPDQTIVVRVRKREEKGSDVNLATCLLVDVFKCKIDAAIVISNDSDLALPIKEAREVVPVGLLNPQIGKRLAGALKGRKTDGVGRHWWARIEPEQILNHQLPAQIGRILKPLDW